MSATERPLDLGLLLLRLGMGGMFLFVHGGPKLLGGPEMWAKVGAATQHLGMHFLPMMWGFLAACAEGLGGLCLMLGIFTRPAAALMAITMAVATMTHLTQGDGVQVASHAIEAGLVFIGLLVTGPGEYSVERTFFSRSSAGSQYTLP